MKLNKKFFYNIHTWIGIKLSILFFIVCFSGTIATLSSELDWLFNKEIRATPSDKTVPLNKIIKEVRQLYPTNKINNWYRSEAPYLCDIIFLRENNIRVYIFANPYTGKVQGINHLTFQRFFRDLHYYLFIPGKTGKYLVLIFSFLLLISLITALYFYKKWWKKLFKLQLGKGSLVFFRSFHKLIGLWSIPFTILFSITGIWYFIERANVGNVSSQIKYDAPKVKFDKEYDNYDFSKNFDYDKAIKIAKDTLPNFKPLSISISNKNVYIRGKTNVPLVRQRANRVYINPLTYEVLKIQDAKKINTFTWINDIADPLHFGTFGGLTTKIIWFIMGLGISGLVLSGIWTTLKRRAISRKKQNIKSLGYWKYVNISIVIYMTYNMEQRLNNKYLVDLSLKIVIYTIITVLVLLTYYIFVYKLKEAVKKLE